MPTKLGQGRAEEDSEMLQQAFVETTDYRMLIEGDGRRVVVGRRGTGKSALALKLAERSGKDEGTILITIGADEEDHIGIRERLERFKGGYGSQKAAAKLVWLYGIYQEIQRRVNDRGKQNRQGRGERKQRGVDWERAGRNVEERIWEALKQFGEQGEEGAEVGELSKRLGIRGTQESLARVLQEGREESAAYRRQTRRRVGCIGYGSSGNKWTSTSGNRMSNQVEKCPAHSFHQGTTC